MASNQVPSEGVCILTRNLQLSSNPSQRFIIRWDLANHIAAPGCLWPQIARPCGSPKKSFVHLTHDVSVCDILLLSFVLVFSVFTERTTKYLAGLAVECQCEFSTLGGLSVPNSGLLLSWDKRARIGEPAALATALTQKRDKKKPQACADVQLLQLCTPSAVAACSCVVADC